MRVILRRRSLAFALPIATPPNAIAYATDLVVAREMLQRGALLNLVGVVVIVAFAFTLAPAVFDLAAIGATLRG